MSLCVVILVNFWSISLSGFFRLFHVNVWQSAILCIPMLHLNLSCIFSMFLCFFCIDCDNAEAITPLFDDIIMYLFYVFSMYITTINMRNSALHLDRRYLTVTSLQDTNEYLQEAVTMVKLDRSF